MRRWWTWMRCARRDAAEGQTLMLFALLLPVLAGITGIALDAGNLYFQRRHLQSIADAAALTGAQASNFDVTAPAILVTEGTVQARANAIYNGALESEIQVHVPPSADAGAFAGRPDYIEVVVIRTVPNAFMGLFGYWNTTTHARAVARCFMPGYGDAAILALDTAPDAITFNGGASQAVNVVGDIISNGGIDANGNASHFQIDGAAYAISQPTTTNLTTTNGSFGTDSGVSLWPVADPIVEAQQAGTVVWPNFTDLGSGTAHICNDPWPSSSGACPDPLDPGQSKSGNFTVNSSDYAIFKPGKYGKVTIRGKARFVGGTNGIFSFEQLTLGSQSVVTDQPNGVLIHVWGSGGLTVDGGAQIDIHAITPNEWMNVAIYVPNGDVNLEGTGSRSIDGSIYAPNGTVSIRGDGDQAVVQGQVIADRVEFSGNGPTVQYQPIGIGGTFGPVLVNLPD